MMTIPMTSGGSLVVGDEHAAEVSGEATPEHALRIPARVWYQTRFTSSSITVVVTLS